jgi:hypothetical protein
MMPPAHKPLAVPAPVLLGMVCLLAFAGAHGEGSPAVAEPSAAATVGSSKPKSSPKPPKNSASPSAKGANKPLSKDIPIPLPIGDVAKMIKIPQTGTAGELLSQLMAVQMKRIDETHVEMQEMKIDLYQPDGKTDFHIEIPTSVFDLKTRLIHSENPVVVRTQDFELTGEKMEFDTVERSGKLLGRVHMRIHDLKKAAGDDDQKPNQ